MTELKNQVSIGNLLQIAVMIIGVGLAWGVMSARADQAERDLSSAQSSLSQIEIRVRTLETSDARNDERLTTILATLGRIDQRLERMERQNDAAD
jgi:hypothetical protein